jgi:hypothetical protein
VIINLFQTAILGRIFSNGTHSRGAVRWLRRLVDGLPLRRPGLDLGSVHVGFMVNKVTLRQIFTRVIWFSPVNFILPVLHYKEKRKKIITFITGLHNKPQGCGASVASAARPFTTKKKRYSLTRALLMELGTLN